MTSETIKTCFLAAVVFSLVLVAGCAVTAPDTDVSEARATEPLPEPPVTEPAPEPAPTVPAPEPPPQVPEPEVANLVLKFEPGESMSYKVVTESTRSVIYEGSLAKDPTFTGGDTGDRVEMTFSQQLDSVNEQGNAVATITIKQLKYQAQVKSDIVLDFDSSRDEDQNNPLAKLVGQSYTIEITRAGQVTEVIDSKEALAAVKGNATARRLLESNTIKERHSIPALPAPGKNEVAVDEHWSSIKSTDFGMMGAKSYERIYVLKQIKEQDGRRSAYVEMNAIPTAETAEQLHQEQSGGAFSKMFDNIEEYTGELQWDLTEGKVETYSEQLRSEWLVVDPTPVQKPDKKPDALRMTSFSLYSLERVD
ncbi:MAG: hypothetical protein ACYST6_02715 [Planctomycetota bacterium]|jgi:hypothetical protein